MTLSLLALAAAAAVQAPTTDSARLESCAALARANPDEALARANEWRIRGGGIPARQCQGLAYAALERWPSAATAFEQAARAAGDARDPRASELWVQTGNAWLAAEEPTRAIEAFDAALAGDMLTPESRGLIHLDRARALVDLGNIAAARGDLQRGLELAPGDPFAWYLSAALARREGSLDRARTDIARALELAPGEPDFLLLAGTIAGLAGDAAEARGFYERAAAGPDSPAAAAARAALAAPPPPAEAIPED
ncbi:MAG: tetratricopeptide repeat protein [Allosphingosinicella sp.]|uniref:tetratricopeptide repeat protein n=1 Tax=Allosphingosinicella sp. TaxID=2823234 RepID=UPI0039276B60